MQDNSSLLLGKVTYLCYQLTQTSRNWIIKDRVSDNVHYPEEHGEPLDPQLNAPV